MSLYLKIEDASSLLFSDAKTRVASPALYLGWQAEQIETRGIARVWRAADRLEARVNHGRWITDCLACASGVYTHPAWRLACCANCGAIYNDVEVPANIAEITRLLLERPRRETQNWDGEALWRLRGENALHRLAS